MMTGFVQAAVVGAGVEGGSSPSCDSSQCRSIEVEVRARKNVLCQYKTVITGSLKTMWRLEMKYDSSESIN